MRIVGYGIAALAACVAFTGVAQAQVVVTKGAGKTSASIIKYPVVNPNQKAAGSIASKPSASVVGKPPTGGATTTVKLAKDLGDPLKPGYGLGNYMIDIETGVTSDGNVAVHVYITLSVDSLFKCTAHPAETSANESAGQCEDVPVTKPMCAPEAPGKCVFTTYQAAGVPNYTLGPGGGQPTASRMRLRINTDPVNCKTGDIVLGLTPVPATSTCSSGSNTVVGVMGVANGTITTP